MPILRRCVLGKETLNIPTSNGADDQWIIGSWQPQVCRQNWANASCLWERYKVKNAPLTWTNKKQFKVNSQMKCIKSCNSKEKRTVIR